MNGISLNLSAFPVLVPFQGRKRSKLSDWGGKNMNSFLRTFHGEMLLR